MSGESFALVVLEEEFPVAARELAGPLAKAMKVVRYDALNALKLNPHIPFQDLDSGTASAAVECLAGAGVRAVAVDSRMLPGEPRIFTVHNADAVEGGLDIQTDLAGSMRMLEWEAIQVVSAATVSETTTAHGFDGGAIQQQIHDARIVSASMTHGMVGASAMAQPDFKPESRTDVYQVLCLMPREVEIEIRFRADQFNYDYLADRRKTNSAENFQLLAGDIISRVATALIHGPARALAESGTLPPPTDKHHLARMNRWLRLRAREGL
ncbi:MAG: hypothetical protein ACYTGB_02865 [Planctomycetota bacterium]|jgi:hypothetical protein